MKALEEGANRGSTMNNPKISIIIPVYNVENYLKRCLDSLINQTFQDIEIICINDCSTDNSLQILNDYALGDKRIKVIDSNCNEGAAIARNKGLEIAQGEYLSFVDSDDSVDLDFYKNLYTKAKEKDYDIVKCPRKKFEINGHISIGYVSDKIKNEGIYAFTHEWQAAIYKTSLVKDNNICFVPEIIKAQDIVFLNKVILKTKTYALIDNTFYNYYRRKNSLHSDFLTEEKYKSALYALDSIVNNINQEGLYNDNPEAYNRIFLFWYHSIFPTYFQTKDEKMKSLAVKTIFELKNKCKDKEFLYHNFRHKWLLKYIQNNKVSDFEKEMLRYSNYKDFYYNLTPLQKIFSITNKNHDNGKIYKVITILGIKFKFKKKL